MKALGSNITRIVSKENNEQKNRTKRWKEILIGMVVIIFLVDYIKLFIVFDIWRWERHIFYFMLSSDNQVYIWKDAH